VGGALGCPLLLSFCSEPKLIRSEQAGSILGRRDVDESVATRGIPLRQRRVQLGADEFAADERNQENQ